MRRRAARRSVEPSHLTSDPISVYTHIMTRDRATVDANEAVHCTCFSVRKAARAVTQLYDAALEPSGLRATQFSLLASLRIGGPLTISRLAEAMVMDRTTLTRNLRPLDKQGLVSVAPGRDRRTRQVRLTARGRTRFTQAFPLWQRAQAQMAKGLGAARRKHLLSDLDMAVATAQRT